MRAESLSEQESRHRNGVQSVWKVPDLFTSFHGCVFIYNSKGIALRTHQVEGQSEWPPFVTEVARMEEKATMNGGATSHQAILAKARGSQMPGIEFLVLSFVRTIVMRLRGCRATGPCESRKLAKAKANVSLPFTGHGSSPRPPSEQPNPR